MEPRQVVAGQIFINFFLKFAQKFRNIYNMNNILPGDIICLKASWASKLPYWSFWAIVYRGLIAGQKLFIKNPKYLHVGTVVNMPPTLLTTGNLVPVIEEEYNGPIKDLKALNSSFFNEFDV